MPSGVYIRTQEHCDNIRKALSDPKVKKKMRESHLGVPVSDKTRKKLSIALTGIKRKPVTQETREKMRINSLRFWKEGKIIGMTGRRHSKETIDKLSGKNSPKWKGGITSKNDRIRKSYRYKEWRKNIFKRDNYTCQMCSVRGGNLQADHIKPFSLFPKLIFELENGRTLCKTCHETTDTYGGKMLNYFPKTDLKNNAL